MLSGPLTRLLVALFLPVAAVPAATVVWNGPAITNASLSWSFAGNWTGGVPGGGDDVKFYDAGALPGISNVNNTVDAGILSPVGSLQFGSTNNFHTTLIGSGVTLLLTNSGGLNVVTPGDANQGAAAASVRALTNWATLAGAGGKLAISNSAASVVVNQGSISNIAKSFAVLDLSGLDTFSGNFSRIGIGTITSLNPGSTAQREAGGLYLARTNYLTLTYADSLANYLTSGKTNAIELSRNPGNNGGAVSFLYLGISNVLQLDSLGAGLDKSGNNSTPASGVVAFNPDFTNWNPVAVFRGVTGGVSRVTWWSVGDGNASSSTSNGGRGTNDFSNGTVDALINVLSLGRECDAANTGWAGPHAGVFTFTAGTVDVNTVYDGNQAFSRPTSVPASSGTLNVSGPSALLRVNSALTLGYTTVPYIAGSGGSGTNAWRTSGNLIVNNGGKVWANSVAVGAASVTNNIRLNSGTLIVSNAMATNASGLFLLAATNSLLGLTVPPIGSRAALVQTLVTGGATNVIQINPTPVFFGSYPAQGVLLKYTSLTGAGFNFGLTNRPGWAWDALLSNNIANGSLDLVLPTDPRPGTTAPAGYSGSPGDSPAFTAAASGAAPLSYQWCKDGVPLVDGPTGNGSTNAGASTGTLVIQKAQTTDSANAPGYTVVVTNLYGAVTSSPALLVISAGPGAPSLTGPSNQTVIQGGVATFAATVSGSPVPTLRWQTGGSDIPGATASTLQVTNVQYPANDQQVFFLIASNSAGSAVRSATLTVIVLPVVTVQPTNQMVTNSQAASLTVVATGVPAPAYQWYKNGAPISLGDNSTARSPTFSLASAGPSDAGVYSCVISNLAGATSSASATLSVVSTLSIAALAPVSGQTGACYDTPLRITFSQVPTLRTNGAIRIFCATNPATPVDIIDLAATAANGTQPHSLFPGDSQPFNYYPVVITGSTATIYPHGGVMASNQIYYVTIDSGAFADATGAYFAGILETNVWRFATKVSGPADPAKPVVAADGTADFATVQGAVDSLPVNAAGVRRIISIKNGAYFEIVDIAGKTNLTLCGQSREGTILCYPNNAGIAPGGTTHARMTLKVNANDIALDNLTVSNSTPQGGGQAEALMIESSARRCLVHNCEIDSRQDTLLANVNSSQGYFYNTTLCGNFDFIWGGGNLFFDRCTLRTISGTGSGQLTAGRTDTAAAVSTNFPWLNPSGTYTANGMSFVNCAFQADPGLGGVTLAGSNGTSNNLVSWVSCRFATNYVAPSASLFNGSYVFWQNQNTDLTGSNALAFSSLTSIGVTNGDPRLLAATNVAAWFYGWTPKLAPNITNPPVAQAAVQGQTAVFGAGASGLPAPAYQWLKDGISLPGATGTSLVLSNVQSADAAGYSVVASNSSGSVTSAAVALTVQITNRLVAFPGAEGAGAFTSGGRGGDVYYVTSLSDTGAGTLRTGISTAPAGGRTILFKVSGNIALNSTLTINMPNLTIAGQSAPGDGICIQDESFNIAANNVVVRHLRTRLGTNHLAEADAMWINSGTNIIVDHLSASWSVDETLSASREIANLTVQNCFITESLQNSIHVKGAHGYGGIISSAFSSTYSYLRNLYAHHDSRNPRVGSDSQAGTLRLDFRNNVVYDWGFRAGYSGATNENSEMNYVGNYFIAGPSSSSTSAFLGGGETTGIYQSGNFQDTDKDGWVDGVNTGWAMFTGTYAATNDPYSVPAATTESAAASYQRVVALSGAMPWRRDTNDQRIARTVRLQSGMLVDFVGATNQSADYVTNSLGGTNYIGVRGWPALGAATAPADADSDGMPDYWELAVGLNPNLASDRNLTNASPGYTRLEEYLNWLADAHGLCSRNGSVDLSLRAATGGATNLTYSVSSGSNGSVSLLGDGYTARFNAAPGTNGMAGFTFTATDPAAAVSFGPVGYGILITTTNAVNTAPTLAAITNYTGMAGVTLVFTNRASDVDLPAQTLTFSLLSPSAGATVTTNSGVFNWRPAMVQGGSSNTFRVVVTDSGVPALSATQAFGVRVTLPTNPVLQSAGWTNGLFSLRVSGNEGPDYRLQTSTNLLNWADATNLVSPTLPFLWIDPGAINDKQRFYRAQLGP